MIKSDTFTFLQMLLYLETNIILCKLNGLYDAYYEALLPKLSSAFAAYWFGIRILNFDHMVAVRSWTPFQQSVTLYESRETSDVTLNYIIQKSHPINTVK